MRLTGGEGGASCGDFGFDGSRPRRPFKLSVRTTEESNTYLSLLIRLCYYNNIILPVLTFLSNIFKDRFNLA